MHCSVIFLLLLIYGSQENDITKVYTIFRKTSSTLFSDKYQQDVASNYDFNTPDLNYVKNKKTYSETPYLFMIEN